MAKPSKSELIAIYSAAMQKYILERDPNAEVNKRMIEKLRGEIEKEAQSLNQ